VDFAAKGADIVAYGGTSDAGMNLDIHVVSEGDHHFFNLVREFTSWGEDEGLTAVDGTIFRCHYVYQVPRSLRQLLIL